MRSALRRLGIAFAQEVKIDRYSADFVLRREGIVLECDGVYWHNMKDGRDKSRDRHLRSMGWRVVRVTDKQVKRLGAEVALRRALNLPSQPLLFSEHQPGSATARRVRSRPAKPTGERTAERDAFAV